MEPIVRQGIGVSPGIAIGPALVLERRLSHVPKVDLPPERVELEIERLESALATAREQLRAIEAKAGAELGSGIAHIIDAQRMMLEDASFLERIRERIRKLGQNAEWAVKAVGDDLSARFSRISDPYLRERGNDLDDLATRLLRNLKGQESLQLDRLPEPVILLAYDLAPSDTAILDREHVLGFGTDVGGRTSHTAIMARTMEIPAVVGLHDATERVRSGDTIIIDGNEGIVVIDPTPAVLREYRNKRASHERHERELMRSRDLPAVTPDGVSVGLLANIERAADVDLASAWGCEGVGLFRSEFLYLRREDGLPTEQDHYREYRTLLEALEPLPVTIRTVDLGGEKDLPGEMGRLQEAASLLGLRGIRHALRNSEAFQVQLRGLLRASVHGTLRIVLPFVSGVEELRLARDLLNRARHELEEEGHELSRDVSLGVMVEVPAAALIADHLAEEADFLSIGTNDLIQYLLAVDRTNDAVAHLYEPLHPAVLRLVEQVVRAARQAEIPVTLCGEAASDPLTAMVYLGFGIDELSMSPAAIPVIKGLVRRLPFAEAHAVLALAMELPTAREVEELALERLMAHFPDGFMVRG